MILRQEVRPQTFRPSECTAVSQGAAIEGQGNGGLPQRMRDMNTPTRSRQNDEEKAPTFTFSYRSLGTNWYAEAAMSLVRPSPQENPEPKR